MIELSQPSYLIGLSSLLIVLLIHLLNRREPKAIKVGSVDLFEHSESVKIKRIKFSEWLLFLLRSLIFILLVLLIVEPLIESANRSDHKKWLLLDPAINESALKNEIDSLENLDFERHYLSHGFPDVKIESEQNTNFWSLLNELNQHSDRPDSVIVYSSSIMSKFRLNRPEISYHLKWIHQANAKQQNKIIAASNNKFIRQMSDETINKFKLVDGQMEDEHVVQLDTILVRVYLTKKFNNDFLYLKAAFEAIDQNLAENVHLISTNINDNIEFEAADLIILLSDKHTYVGSDLLLFFEASNSDNLITKVERNYKLTRRLQANLNPNIYAEDLVNELIQILPIIDSEQFRQNDLRIISSSQIQLIGQNSDSKVNIASFQPFKEVIWFLLLFSIALERLYSMRRQT